jgi:CRISPR system Cascade subunit CasE
MPVRGREDIARWFAERSASSWGFVVSPEHLQIDKIEVQQFKDKNQRQVTIAQAHVQGIFETSNSRLFQNSFVHGVGRGRAYGCGLLQIIPLIDNPFA